MPVEQKQSLVLFENELVNTDVLMTHCEPILHYRYLHNLPTYIRIYRVLGYISICAGVYVYLGMNVVYAY